jgi:hypothetical protein
MFLVSLFFEIRVKEVGDRSYYYDVVILFIIYMLCNTLIIKRNKVVII